MKRFMDAWRTAIADSDGTHIWLHGYDVTALMTRAGFTDTIFLLHRGRLPETGERRLLDAILVGVADHGAGAPSCAAARLAASGNRHRRRDPGYRRRARHQDRQEILALMALAEGATLQEVNIPRQSRGL